MPAPTLDGTATGTNSGGTTISATLTTTGANDIICALVEIEIGSAGLWITGVAGGGLTWTRRTHVAVFPGVVANRANTLSLWWAVAPSPLAAVVITATGNAAWDDAAILVFGVSGCNTTNPWDANASLAARQIGFGTPSFPAISTTQANDFQIFAWGSNNNATMGTLPTGFTSVGYILNGGGSNFAAVGAAYRGVTTTQTNQTYAWGSNIGGGNAAIFDALTADTGGSTTAPRPSYEALGYKYGSSTNNLTVATAGISANDVIVIVSYAEQSGGGPAVSSVSGGSLTWVLRTRSHASARGSLEIWSAKVTGTLAGTTFTITYAATFDTASVVALSVVGCDTSVWDANAALPKVLSNTAGGSWTPSVSGVATTQAHDMLLAATGTTFNDNNAAVVPAGFTFITLINSTVSAAYAYLGIGMQARSATQSGAMIAWGAAIADPVGTSAGGEYVIDALTADAPGVTGGVAVQARVLVLA